MNLKKYVLSRRAELKAEREHITRQTAGITTGRLMAFDQRARVLETLLTELDNLADWVLDGEQDFIQPLDAAEREFWLKVKAQNLPVPDRIEAQL